MGLTTNHGKLAKIVSGGQTGVDRGALDAALQASFPCGGWCPDGRKAEDGPIPAKYPVVELPGASYEQRTRRNVADSDGTLILYFWEISGGTLKTLQLCNHLRKCVLTLDVSKMSPKEAATQATEFIRRHHIGTLNVAGPRASGVPHAQTFAFETILILLRSGEEVS